MMMNIKNRLALILAAFSVLCVAIASVSLHGLAGANERSEKTYRELSLPSQHLSDAYLDMLIVALQVYEANRLNDLTLSKKQFEIVDSLVPHIKKTSYSVEDKNQSPRKNCFCE